MESVHFVLSDMSIHVDGMCSSTGNRNIVAETDEIYSFPENSLRTDRVNVITIVQVFNSVAEGSQRDDVIVRTTWV
jgi:hypothetical protein